MNIKNLFQKNLDRKRFFGSVGTGFLTYFVFRSFPFNFFAKNQKEKSSKIEVRINPLAVQRKKMEKSNG